MILKFSKIKNKNQGYSLLEIVFYISLFAVVSILVINSMIVMMRSFRETKINIDLAQNSSILEKISREIKQADSIASLSSNSLTLNSDSQVINFALSGTDVTYTEDGNLIGNLNTSTVMVTNLTFNQLTTNLGQSVKIVLSFKSKLDPEDEAIDFYDTIIIRGNY